MLISNPLMLVIKCMNYSENVAFYFNRKMYFIRKKKFLAKDTREYTAKKIDAIPFESTGTNFVIYFSSVYKLFLFFPLERKEKNMKKWGQRLKENGYIQSYIPFLPFCDIIEKITNLFLKV